METLKQRGVTSAEDIERLQRLSRLVRHWILTSTSASGSGHPTSSLSAVELMVDLMFGGHFRYDAARPDHPNNDRMVFSKGHASPLLYALWAAAGQVTEEELRGYREFRSPLEGHPTSRFRFAEAATGSLGQGLSIGVGMALNARHLDRLPYRTYVLLGDSEMAEGAHWEAIQIATHYKLGNLIGVLDVNRLGQRGETMYGHDLDAYRRRVEAFGWRSILVEDGHDHALVLDAYRAANEIDSQPTMIIAKTVKGKGVAFLAGEGGWHGKALDGEQLAGALEEVGEVDPSLRGRMLEPADQGPPDQRLPPNSSIAIEEPSYGMGEEVATRSAYGKALCRIAPRFPGLVSLDGEVCNSTRSQEFRDRYPDRFFEMYVAEQNMAGVALGLSLRRKVPFVSTFAAFLTRAFDQIRMSPYSEANLKFVGSHAGVSIGEDGPSQMGLEDIAMFRTILDSVVLYPCDAMSTERLVEAMAEHHGISYLRTTRGATPVIYDDQESFPIGGSKVLRHSDSDRVTVVAAGVTVHEALEACEQLREEGLSIRVIDLYSVKPLDLATLREAAVVTDAIVTVEDHYAPGGIGEAVCRALATPDAQGQMRRPVPIHCLAVHKRPLSGTPKELLNDQGIGADAITKTVKQVLKETIGGPDAVERASEDSFPASDAPSWTPINSP